MPLSSKVIPVDYTPKPVQQNVMRPSLSASDLLELSTEVKEINPDLPHRRNGFTHSAEVTKEYERLGVIQKERDIRVSMIIADPMSYMAIYHDSRIDWSY